MCLCCKCIFLFFSPVLFVFLKLFHFIKGHISSCFSQTFFARTGMNSVCICKITKFSENYEYSFARSFSRKVRSIHRISLSYRHG
jgi:hypothetical protein